MTGAIMRIKNDIFEAGCDMMDVTSNNRPDPNWQHTDVQGHLHRWHVGDVPATSYSPGTSYHVPTLKYVIDREGGDDYPDVGHFECRECGEHVHRGTRPDDFQQFIPGIRWYKINNQYVDPVEFRRRLNDATLGRQNLGDL